MPRPSTVMPRTLVIVNPAAGGGRAQRARRVVAGYLRDHGWPADFVELAGAEHTRRCAAEAAASGYARVAALGGDGTFLHVVNGALEANLPVGLLPSGGGNDVAAALGIPRDPVAAAHIFLTCSPRRMDVVRARFADGRSQHYVGVGGIGLDAEAARLASRQYRWLPGAARYVVAALRALASFQPLRMEIENDGKVSQSEAMLVVVANTPAYGGGFRIAPQARADDGWLDLTVVAPLGWTRVLEALPILLRTGELDWPEIRRCRARRVVLRTLPSGSRPATFHGDGELLGETPVEVEVLPGALQVVAPKK